MDFKMDTSYYKSLNGIYFVPKLQILVHLTFLAGFDSYHYFIPKDGSTDFMEKAPVSDAINMGTYHRASEAERVLYGS